MATKQPKLRPGDVVAGRFRIVEVIGSGGFSVVYRAHQEDMNRFVALKVLKPTASHDAKIVERFRREALYASHLSHPNTITLFDYGHTDDGLCYIAMEFLLGNDLAAVVQRHIPMDLKRVWRILIQCCRSLAEAHRLGLVHRDLKPENIFLCKRDDGEFVKVLDFGVSKAIQEFGDAGPNTMAPLTQEGTVFGTPLYMAPEQAMAEAITPAVDVYALGHIIFEMITGHAAYESCTNAMDVMLRQINDPPLALPAPWDNTPFSSLITRATQKDPEHRLQGAAAMIDALMASEFDDWIDPSERPKRTRSMPRAPMFDVGNLSIAVDEDVEEIYRWELEVLDNDLRDVIKQQVPRLVVIRGIPGTGRSNLLRAFLSKVVQDPSIKVLHRSNEPDSETSLENELCSLTGVSALGAGIDEVKRILTSLYGDEGGGHEDGQDLSALSSFRDTLLGRISIPFRQAAEIGPLVWGIENLERLDTLTLAFLDRFFREVQASPIPIFLIVTCSPEDLDSRPGLIRYTQGLLQAQRPFGRQLALVPPGERKDDTTQRMSAIPMDIAVDGSYIGFQDVPSEPVYHDSADIDDQSDSTDRLVADNVSGAFDRILGYLAQLGDDVPHDLWKLVYARILDNELIRVVDVVMTQAERFGIIQRTDDALRFSKPGFSETLRESFEERAEAESAHRKLGELMEGYYSSPGHENVKAIARHYRLGGQVGRAVSMLHTAGEKAFAALDLDASREYYLQIQKILDSRPAGIDVERAQVWIRLGEIHGALGEHGAAQDALSRALTEADPNDREIRGRAHRILGDLAASQERHNDALKSYEKARDAYRNLGQARPFVAITSDMGRCALAQGRASLAEDLSRQALEMSHKLRDAALVARVHRHLGEVLTRRARFPEALEHLDQSLQLFERQGRDLEVVECLTELGDAAFASARFTEARQYFTRAIALSSSLHLQVQHEAHLGLARTLAALENVDQAEVHLAEALMRASAAQDRGRIAELHVYLGDIQLIRRDHPAALDHYRLSAEVSESIGLRRQWVAAMIRSAYVALDQNDEAEIFRLLGRALQRSEQIQDLEGEYQVKAHLIYMQLLLYGFPATGDTFSALLSSVEEAGISRANVLCYVFRSDVAASRGIWAEARDFLRYAHVGAAQVGDYALFIPIARRTYIVQKEVGQLGDPQAGAGYAIGAMIPPEVGRRRFDQFPKAT
jgi:serine/threonine protein kinase/tetratricopeptide (TPR) repeat protein